MMQSQEPLGTWEAEEELQAPSARKKKSQSHNKKRFSDEQIRSLETIFKSETKLDPGKKVQVAKELGLQPRQVAIWFQNKRARWKSKQIESNYRLLKANYDNLKAQFEAMRKENESLLLQLKELLSVLEASSHGRSVSYQRDGDTVILLEEIPEAKLSSFMKEEETKQVNISENIWCNFGSAFDQSTTTTTSYWWESWT